MDRQKLSCPKERKIMDMEKRLNSLKGIGILACIAVFFCHFRLAFAPDKMLWIDSTPLRLMTSSGDTAIRIMFAVSGALISYDYFCGRSYEEAPADILKRYFRLAPNVLAAHLIVYILMTCGFLYNAEAAQLSGSLGFLDVFNDFVPKLFQCLREAAFSCFLMGESSYIGPLWVMTYEFLGGLLVLAIIGLCRGNRTLRFIVYLIILSVFSSYYNYFILGMIVSELCAEGSAIKWLDSRRLTDLVLFFISLFIVSMLDIDDTNKTVRILFGAGLLLLLMTMIGSSWAEKLLGNRLMLLGGALAYPVYVLHWPVIESFSSWLYIRLFSMGLGHRHMVLIDLALTSILIAAVAWMFHTYVEAAGRGAIKYIDRYMKAQSHDR